jgi:hypothetical protein
MTLALDGLTGKQEAFCQALFSGMTQKDAYLAAGYSPDQLPDTIYEAASHLAAEYKIITRLKQLQALAEAQAGLSMAEKRGICKEIASNIELRPRDRLVAVDIDNKQMRVYADQPQGSTSYTFNVIVRGPETRAIIDQLLAGTRSVTELPVGETESK